MELAAPADLTSLLHLGGTTHTNAGDYTNDSWNFDGNGNYNAASSATVHDQIAQAGSTTVVTINDAIYNGSPHGGTALVTGAGSLSQSLTVNYAGRNGTLYPSSTTAPTNPGDYTASATFDGDQNHTGSSDSQGFTIDKVTPTATLAVTNSPVPYDGTSHAPTVAILVSSVPGSLSNILIGGSATQINANTYAVTADFIPADTTDYKSLTGLAAGNFVIEKVDQLTLTVTGPDVVTYGTPATISLEGGSGTGAVTYAAISSTGCSVDATTGEITVSTVSGTCTVSASKAEDENYNAVTSDAFVVGLLKAAGSISIANLPGSAQYGGSFTPVYAHSGDGSISVVSLTLDVCTENAGVIDFVNVGTCTLKAALAEGTNYLAASGAEQSFTIGLADQTISFDTAAPVNAKLDGSTYTPQASATSGLPVTITVADSSALVCSISGGVVSFSGSGTCLLLANQPGNGFYNPAPQAQQSFAVLPLFWKLYLPLIRH